MGRLERLDRDRETLAKAWLVRLIERSSLSEIAGLATDRIATALPLVVADVLTAAASERPSALPVGAAERVAGLAEVLSGTPAGITRDLGTVQLVVLDALRDEAADLGSEELSDIACGLAEAVAAVQAAACRAARRGEAGERLAGHDRPPDGPVQPGAPPRHTQPRPRPAQALRPPLLAAGARPERPGARQRRSRSLGAGDRVLMQTALAVRRTIRSVDTAARVGGDEMCVLAPEQGAADMANLARRLVEAIRTETALPDEPGMDVAIGVVACPSTATTPSTSWPPPTKRCTAPRRRASRSPWASRRLRSGSSEQR